MSYSRALLVVTPTLGRSLWLDRTVTSVLAHAGRHAVHVLVAPSETHPDLQRRFPHCLLIADTASRGVYPAINLGLVNAPETDWRWFTWINDDDELTPGFAPHLSRALTTDGLAPDAPWHFGQVQLLNGEGTNLGRLAVARFCSDILPLAQSGVNPLNQQGLLIPRSWCDRYGPLREDLRICADVDFWLRAAVAGAKFRFSREIIAMFRLRAGQISGDVDRHRAEFRRVVNTLAPVSPSKLRQLFARARFRLGNAGVYADRIRRCGLKGGFALLQQPASKTS